MSWGEAEQWSPSEYLHQRHPGVRVEEIELPGGLQGCVDHERRVVWLDSSLLPVERRCTLAFEIGQLEHGPTPADPCLAAAHRRDAADWAARMLIDIDELVAAFGCSSDLIVIADQLEVDLPTLRTRLRGLSDAEQDAVMDAIRGMRAVA